MTYCEVIKKRITELCEKRKISYNQLAQMSGVGQATISDILNLKTKIPGLKTINELAHGFCMTASEFLNFPEMNEGIFEDE